MQAQAGNDTAFRELVESNMRRVYSLALKYTGSHQDADDASQEAFIRAYKSLPKFKGNARFSTWIYRIAVNCCISLKRKQSRWGDCLDEEFAHHIEDDDAFNQEQQTMSKQTRAMVGAAIETLSPQQRAVFVMKYLQQKKIREIADVLECAEGTVKQQLYRAVRKMRDELKPLVSNTEVAQ